MQSDMYIYSVAQIETQLHKYGMSLLGYKLGISQPKEFIEVIIFIVGIKGA